MGTLYDRVPLEFLTQSCLHYHQKFVNYDSGFSAPAVVPTEVSAVVVILCICLPVSTIQGTAVCLVTSLILKIKEELIFFFSLFSCLVFVRAK